METLETAKPETLDRLFSDSPGPSPVHTGSNSQEDGTSVSVGEPLVAVKTSTVVETTEVSVQLNGGKEREVGVGHSENAVRASLESVKESGLVNGSSKGVECGLGGETKKIDLNVFDSIDKAEVWGDNVPLAVQVKGDLAPVGIDVNKVAEMEVVESPKAGMEGEGSKGKGGNEDTPVEDVPGSDKDEEDGVQEDGEGKGKEEEELDGGEQEFSVGDFVWGKVKSHPWWPGQIYDSSDASTQAAKYKRKGGLLVAYFGDGSFGWSYPAQLKPFRENYDELVKQSNSRIFLKAVKEAVEAIGRHIEMEASACVPVGISSRLVRPLAVNVGIKEGVFVPDGDIDELSLTRFEPAELIAHLRDIAQVVSLDNMLELTVLKGRLSAFYRSKGYEKLPVYHQPLDMIALGSNAENTIVGNGKFEGQSLDVTETLAEGDWLSSPVGPWLRGTGSTLSKNWAGISEEKLYHRKKQRSMAELMAGDTGEKPEEGGTVVADKGPGSGKATSTLEKRKKKKDSDANGSGAAEALTASGKQRTCLRKRNKHMDMDVGNDSGVVEELTDCGKRAAASRRRKKNVDSEAGDGSGVAEGLVVSGSRTRVQRKRNNTKGSEVGDGNDEDEELTFSGNSTRASRKRKKTIYPEVGEDSDLVAELTMSGNSTRELRKRNKTNYSEAANDSDAAEEVIVFGSGTPQSSKRKKDNAMEDGNYISISEDASGGSQRALRSKTHKKNEISGSPIATTEKNASHAEEDDGVGSTEGGKLDVPLRERRKSKYLSPPYTILSPELRRNSEKESASSPKISHIDESVSEGAAQLVSFFPLRTCSGEKIQKKLSKESTIGRETSQVTSPRKPKENQRKTVVEDENSSLNEMLTDFRRMAMDPLRMMKKQTYDTITDFFMRLRNSLDHDGSDSIYNETLPATGSAERIPVEVKLGSPGKDNHLADHITTQEKFGLKKRKRKQGEIMNSEKKSKHALVGTSHVKMNHSGEANEKTSEAALLLTFAPGVPLPSKDELVEKFQQFGAVKESKTKLLEDSNCAQVVFAKSSNAEEAYNNSEKINPFGSSVVSYRLRYLPATPVAINQAVADVHVGEVYRPATPVAIDQVVAEVHVGEVSSILSIRQSLEVTTSVLERSWDRLSLDVKANLEDEVKGLLHKVTLAVGSSSF